MSDPASKKVGQKAFTISAITFVIVLVIGFYLSSVLQQQHEESERSQVEAITRSYAYHLKNTIDHNLSSNYTLAGLVREFGGFSRWFPQVAKSLHRIYPEVNNFALSPNGVVEQVYPLEGNEKVLGFNQLLDAEQGSEAWLALTQQVQTLAGPVDLVQGGKGVIARLAIALEDRWGGADQFWGFSNIVIRTDLLMDKVNIAQLERDGYAYRLQRVDTEKTIKIAESHHNLMQRPVVADIDLPNATWRLEVEPQVGWLPDHLMLAYILVSILVALVVARFVFLGFRIGEQKAQLSDLLSEQTQQAHQTAKRLLSTLQAIPDPLIEVCSEGYVIEMHVPDDEMDVKRCFTIGEPYFAHLDEEAKKVFEHVFAEVRQSMKHRGAMFSVHVEDDRVVWLEMSVVFNKPDTDTPGSFMVLLHDVTARQDIEQQQRIAATAFETQDGILISDKNNRIIRVNRAFQRISGYSETEVLGKTPSILNSGRHSKEFYQDMYQQLAEQGSWEGEIWNRRKDGEIYPEWLSISTVLDRDHEVSHFVATFKDISERKASERKIRQLHYYDSLTRLANRTLLLEEMNYLLHEKGLHYRQSAVLFIDLDHFKDVNDVWGHNIGDQLLQQVASRLMDTTRANDTVARFGGDEFLILLEDVDISLNADRIVYRASHVAEKVLKALGRPFELEGNEHAIAASIGIAVFSEQCEDPLDVIKQAELAMYEAKSSGRSQFCFYTASMQQRVLDRVQLENDLRCALEREELTLYVQPQWNESKVMVGAEALLRWPHPERGMISPAVFIPLAEESRLILPIGEWVLRQTCQWLAQWRELGTMKDFVMSVNVSAVQFSQGDFVTRVEEILDEFDVAPNLLQLELTESMLAHDQQDIIAKMEALKGLGVLISLDDFGTGYSSLSYLHRLPIDQLKIDQSFVANIEQGEKNASLAESIISLGHNLGMEVIAEGVETDTQFNWLVQQGCDLFQGFGLAKPMTIEALLASYQDALHVTSDDHINYKG